MAFKYSEFKTLCTKITGYLNDQDYRVRTLVEIASNLSRYIQSTFIYSCATMIVTMTAVLALSCAWSSLDHYSKKVVLLTEVCLDTLRRKHGISMPAEGRRIIGRIMNDIRYRIYRPQLDIQYTQCSSLVPAELVREDLLHELLLRD